MKNEYPRIDVTVDAVVFGYEPAGRIAVLLIKRKKEPFKNCWAIPGGFVEADEDLETAAARELKEETSVEVNHLEQVYTFGDPKRDPRKRIISIAHYTIVKTGEHKPQANDDASEVQWFELDALPALAFDHPKIIRKAIDHLNDDLKKRKAKFFQAFTEAELNRLDEHLKIL